MAGTLSLLSRLVAAAVTPLQLTLIAKAGNSVTASLTVTQTVAVGKGRYERSIKPRPHLPDDTEKLRSEIVVANTHALGLPKHVTLLPG